MSRLSFPAREAMSDAAREVYDATASGRRGVVPANVMVWLRSPVFAARAQKLGEFARYETSLGARRSEIAILVVARHWTAQVPVGDARDGSREGRRARRDHWRHRGTADAAL